MRLVDDQLRQGQFALRWNKCSEREREYLRALAALEPENGNGLVSSAAVAGRLGERPEAVSFLRARLIAKDVIEAGPRHTIGFALPRFEHFVRKQAVDDPIEGELEPGHGPNASDLSKRTRPSRERRGRRDFTR